MSTDEVVSMFDEVKQEQEQLHKALQASNGGMTVDYYKTEEAPTEFDPAEEDVDLTNFRLKAFSDVKALTGCTALSKLTFRQNVIADLTGIEALAPSLTHLDLYENKLKSSTIHPIAALTGLTFLDMSFNSLRQVPVAFSQLPKLKELYLISNKITESKNLAAYPQLRLLELGDNRLRSIENLENLTSIEELYLGRNKIVNISGLDTLTNLRIISLQSNRVVSIGNGFANCVSLEELYLSHNGIHSIEGLDNCVNLRVLDVGNNRIKKIAGLSKNVKLEELWCNRNFIENFDFLSDLKTLPLLNALYLEHNPVQNEVTYKSAILAALPGLTQLDAELYDARSPSVESTSISASSEVSTEKSLEKKAEHAEEDDDADDDDMPDLEA